MAEKQLSAKRAPRRPVLDVVRVGDWGEVEYRHRMSCGHTIVRKRISKAPVLACVDCLRAAAFSNGLLPDRKVSDEVDSFRADIVDPGVQSALASIVGVSAEAVDIVVDADGNIKYGMIFVSADEIARLVS